MYEKLNITENHLKILSLFTKGFQRQYYIREVQKLLNISPRTAQLILDDLEKKTVLESQIKGKIKLYKIKNTELSIHYFILTEQYKLLCFLQKHSLIKEIISKITPLTKGISLIFGSYAKGLEKPSSDLDIFIAGDYNKEEIKKIAALYDLEISIKSYPLQIFGENTEKDIFLKEVLDNHVAVSNIDQFVRTVLHKG